MFDKLKNFKSMYWTHNIAKVKRKFTKQKSKVENKKEDLIENE